MSESIKVHLYQVVCGPETPSFETVLSEAAMTSLQQRLRTVGNHEIRLESVLSPNDTLNNTPYWYLDMTYLRFAQGPAKASRASPLKGFDLSVDEGFGEETAALYDPASGYLLVQYNHHGVRAPSMKAYFSFFNTEESRNYDFRMRLDESFEARLAQKQILTKLSFKVAPATMTTGQRANNVGLGQALALNDSVNGQTVEVIISAGKKNNSMLAMPKASKIINELRNLMGSGEKIVEKFEVTGRNGVGEQAEAIDMLASKLEQKIDGIIMNKDRRYTQESRWNALLRARHGWSNLL